MPDNPFLQNKLESQPLVPIDQPQENVFDQPQENILLRGSIHIEVNKEEGVAKTSEACAVSIVPDVCKLPNNTPVPFQIKGDFGTSDQIHSKVRFRGYEAFTTKSFVPNVIGDDPGCSGGVMSGCCQGVAYVDEGDINRTVRVNGCKVIRNGDPVRMNAPSHGGQHNTIGQVYYNPGGGGGPQTSISENGEINGDTNPPVTPNEQEKSWLQRKLDEAKKIAGQAWDKIKELNQEYKLIERGLGVVTIVGGVSEIVLGAVGVMAPTGITQVLGGIGIVHGADTTWAGLKQVWSGEFQDTYTKKGATFTAKKLGASEKVADWIGTGTDIVTGIAGPVSAVRATATKATEEVTEQVIRETTEETAKNTGKETAEQIGKETAEQTGKETAEQTGKESAENGIEVTKKSAINKDKEIPCFPEGTLILTDIGLRPIEKLIVGDIVITFDIYTKRTFKKSINAVFKNKTECLIEIVLDREKIRTTKSHRFWVDNKQRWIEAKYLTKDMLLQTVTDENIQIQNINILYDREVETFNLSVADYHTYFISQKNILVHNLSAKPTGKIYTGSIDGKIIYVGKTKQPLLVRQYQHLYEGIKKAGKEWKQGMKLKQVLDGLTDDQMKWHERKLYDQLREEGYELKNGQKPYGDKNMDKLENKYCN